MVLLTYELLRLTAHHIAATTKYNNDNGEQLYTIHNFKCDVLFINHLYTFVWSNIHSLSIRVEEKVKNN